MTVTPFSATLAARRRDGDTVHFELGNDWQQGRTAYGGVVCAIAAQAMRDVAGADWAADVSLRALQCSFVSVVAAGAVSVRVEVLRQGRNVCQVQARVYEDGRLGSVLLGVYSAGRPSALAPRWPTAPAVDAAASLPDTPYMDGVQPPFLQHLAVRAARPAWPFAGRRVDESVLHLRLRDAQAGVVAPEVLAVLLGDVPPTPAISGLTAIAPTSSVTWSLELQPLAGVDACGWWRIDSESVCVAGGYVNHAARLWTPEGRLAALGTQVVTVFG
jgi:acyl-CoA thioesterase